MKKQFSIFMISAIVVSMMMTGCMPVETIRPELVQAKPEQIAKPASPGAIWRGENDKNICVLEVIKDNNKYTKLKQF